MLQVEYEGKLFRPKQKLEKTWMRKKREAIAERINERKIQCERAKKIITIIIIMQIATTCI